MKVHVVSTGLNPATKGLCIASVKGQTAIHNHYRRDAAEERFAKVASQNLFEMLTGLLDAARTPYPGKHLASCGWVEPHDVVALVDLDDWLSDAHALERVYHAYESYPTLMVTYGQYMLPTGQLGHCKELNRKLPIRKQPWVTSHLKTFRVEMIKHLREDDFKVNGKWVHRGVDLATMFPLIELAGYDRTMFIPQVSYVYNYASSFEASADLNALAEESDMVFEIRAKTPREQVKW